VIRVENLTMGYGPVNLLEDASFEVEEGEVFAILGGSGTGKSTLLRLLIGLDRPKAGKILVRGREPAAGEGRPGFGVLFQSGALFGSLTLGGNVALPLQAWTDLDPRSIDVIVRAKLGLVGLGGFENHLPSELSGGMKKRAGIARALAIDTPILFLDEPSAGLDPVTASELDDLILTLNASLGTTIVVVTHELPSIFKIARSCIMLDRTTRRIIAKGNPHELRDTAHDPRVRRFFRRESETRDVETRAA
jgi:phospholipid/cholesterol/gamma-HCH transport system ATP-binding protein